MVLRVCVMKKKHWQLSHIMISLNNKFLMVNKLLQF